MKRGGDCIGDDGAFIKRNGVGKRTEIEGRGAHILGITSVAGHAYISFPILAEGFPSAPAKFANLAGKIEMANHPIPDFHVAHFTADIDNLSCDLMA
jgi:hypothetical protein